MLAFPGGESTVQGKLLMDLGLFAPLKDRIVGGLPVFATSAEEPELPPNKFF